jgi:FtsP/CotA-like multicopper oxidase with cupredoxin domain
MTDDVDGNVHPTPVIPTGEVGTENLTAAAPPTVVDVPPNGSLDLRVHPIAKRIAGTTFAMLSYNGSIPGPTLRVRQGSEITVDVTNGTAMETTVHWHGLRLENAYDGVPHETQAPIPVGGRYTHRLTFPDAGLYWYHPHIREDYAQEMGLYGTIIVEPTDPAYWPAADRHLVLTLDDILIEDGRIAPFDPHGPTFAAMGRFGNVLLIGGQTEQHLEVGRGEVVRLHLVNTANTRVFKIAVPGARMKLVGGDSGRFEREEWVDDVVIAPSERAIVDVRFDAVGTFTVRHVTPGRAYPLVHVGVAESGEERPRADEFDVLRVNADMVAERERVERYLDTPPDRTLALVAEMDFAEPEGDGPVVYVCPMHPQIVRDGPGTCPICGMKLMPQAVEEPAASVHGGAHQHDHAEAMADGIEWEDLMPEVNRSTTAANMRWKLVDRDTGHENARIRWTFDAGDQVKVRLVNEMASDHPMHHPFHVHGERFLVLSRDGVPEPNLVWKDTVLVRTGQTVDVLIDASNPGLWMAHCHIAEHMETGMMFSFRVRGSRR